jgi:chitinase
MAPRSIPSWLDRLSSRARKALHPLSASPAPANNATLPAGNVTIEASASATGGTITQVEFFDSANSLGVVTASPYKVTVNLTAGTHSLTAKAIDSKGGSATSAAISVTVGGGGTKIDDPIPAKIAKGNITIELQTVADGLISPLGSAVPDNGSGRMLVYDHRQ